MFRKAHLVPSLASFRSSNLAGVVYVHMPNPHLNTSTDGRPKGSEKITYLLAVINDQHFISGCKHVVALLLFPFQFSSSLSHCIHIWAIECWCKEWNSLYNIDFLQYVASNRLFSISRGIWNQGTARSGKVQLEAELSTAEVWSRPTNKSVRRNKNGFAMFNHLKINEDSGFSESVSTFGTFLNESKQKTYLKEVGKIKGKRKSFWRLKRDIFSSIWNQLGALANNLHGRAR